ncbi:IS630 transposase-related protein [Gloeomargarita sp.]
MLWRKAMARPYSYDLRQKAVAAVLKGAKLVEVSELFGMSIRTVQRWLKIWSETGDYRPKQNDQKGHSAKLTDLERFRQFVEANPGLTQKEMGAILGVSHTTIGQALKKINFTRKKKHTLEEQNEEERQQFIKTMKEEKNEDLVYIDQSGVDNRDI